MSNFVGWLHNGTSTYWINGKAVLEYTLGLYDRRRLSYFPAHILGYSLGPREKKFRSH